MFEWHRNADRRDRPSDRSRTGGFFFSIVHQGRYHCCELIDGRSFNKLFVRHSYTEGLFKTCQQFKCVNRCNPEIQVQVGIT